MAASCFSRYRGICVMFCAIFVVILALLAPVNSHGHEHSHGSEEPPSFKYSQKANVEPDEPAAHGHSHGQESSHGHSHGHDSEPKHGHSHGDGEAHSHGHADARPLSGIGKGFDALLWGQALGATFLVCCAPVFILIFIPLDRSEKHKSLLKVLLAFASGGLLGDAFLHLIPHAISPHDHTEDHSHSHSHEAPKEEEHGHSHSHGNGMTVGLWVLGGIVAFLLVEKFVRAVKGGHGHSHGPKKPPAEETSPNKGGKEVKIKKGKKTEEVEEIKVSAYLNLAADFTHNFTDGLAIGASYLASTTVGNVTTLIILLHEVPHEIGDFAILVQSGCSKRRAMMLQFSTAIGAMLGTLISLCAGGVGSAAIAWVLPFTAGGFIYIATVSVIPELLEDSTLWQTFKEICALLFGIGMMVLIAEME